MAVVLVIIHYFFAAIVDVFDKFLLEKKKIVPIQYTFYTMVTGAVILLAWPFVYEPLSYWIIFWSIFSGMFMSLALYCLYLSMAEGEISRVVPFVFGLVPLFDVVVSWVSGRNALSVQEFSALCLLVPGAFLLAHHKGKWLPRHVLFKIVTALCFSIYFALWQYAASGTQGLTPLMWNRVGAAGILIALLVFPFIRKKVFVTQHIPHKKSTAGIFLFKQFLGGANFIFLSLLFVVGKIPVINALQGFRYAFLFLFALVLSRRFKSILNEEMDRHTVFEKIAGILLIFVGTIILFLAP